MNRKVYEPIGSDSMTNMSIAKEDEMDFDKGFGIGGLGGHQEKLTVLTEKQIERMEKLEKQARYCQRCGDSDVFDGAMFTTGGGNVCDDCF